MGIMDKLGKALLAPITAPIDAAKAGAKIPGDLAKGDFKAAGGHLIDSVPEVQKVKKTVAAVQSDDKAKKGEDADAASKKAALEAARLAAPDARRGGKVG